LKKQQELQTVRVKFAFDFAVESSTISLEMVVDGCKYGYSLLHVYLAGTALQQGGRKKAI
jgi:hypothetical protein